ncbi:MAG: hypothetical protein DRG78_01045 [Epsilonproteobacteria bacterium]|nr:MAG: hypothetical protein DRG78_01045 [Campylobacterota bacterium]
MNKFKVFLIVVILNSMICAEELEVGFGFLNMNYVETGQDGEFLNSEKSGFTKINGFNLVYKDTIGKLDSEDMSIYSLSIGFRKLSGESDYDGYLQDSNGNKVSPHQSTTTNEITETKLKLEHTFYSSSFDYSFFTSLANREWTRDMEKPYGYKEIYSWDYVEVGSKGIYYNGHWEFGLEATVQKAMNPTMKAYLSKVLTFDLGTTMGYNFKIPVGYNIDKKLKIELEYEYDMWEIGKSNVVEGYYEPDSTTKNKIINLNIAYKF